MYQVFEHTADLGLRIEATDLEGLFAQAGQALFSVVVEDLATVQPVETLTFRILGRDHDWLLLDWLTELLYQFESDRLLLAEFEVHFDEDGLTATARGQPYDEERHRLDHEVKAITYHGLDLRRAGEGWQAEVIVDI